MRSNMLVLFKDWILEQELKDILSAENDDKSEYNEGNFDNELEDEIMPHIAIHKAVQSSHKGSLC